MSADNLQILPPYSGQYYEIQYREAGDEDKEWIPIAKVIHVDGVPSYSTTISELENDVEHEVRHKTVFAGNAEPIFSPICRATPKQNNKKSVDNFYKKVSKQLSIAREVATKDTKDRHVKEAYGWEALHLVMNLFEMFAKYTCGLTDKKYRRHFVKGFELVFSDAVERFEDKVDREKYIRAIYKVLRCHLYHVGLAIPIIQITNEFQDIPHLCFKDNKPTHITISPLFMIRGLEKYLNKYVRELKQDRNDRLMDKFLTRMRHDSNYFEIR